MLEVLFKHQFRYIYSCCYLNFTFPPGTECYQKLLTEFDDKDLVDADGKINRSVLGKKVFNDATKLEKLQNIVWPEIWKLAQNEALSLWQSGINVVVLDAAVLIKAGWQKDVHQVRLQEIFIKEHTCNYSRDLNN